MAIKNEELETVEKILIDNRIKYGKARTGSGHHQISWFNKDGTVRRMVVSSTPSDWRGVHNAAADLNRLLKKDGLLRTDEPKEEKKVLKQESTSSVLQKALELAPNSSNGDNSALMSVVYELIDRVAALEQRMNSVSQTAGITINVSGGTVQTIRRAEPPPPQKKEENSDATTKLEEKVSAILAETPPEPLQIEKKEPEFEDYAKTIKRFTMEAWETLKEMSFEEPIRPMVLQKKLGITRNAITQRIAQLKKWGLVERKGIGYVKYPPKGG